MRRSHNAIHRKTETVQKSLRPYSRKPWASRDVDGLLFHCSLSSLYCCSSHSNAETMCGVRVFVPAFLHLSISVFAHSGMSSVYCLKSWPLLTLLRESSSHRMTPVQYCQGWYTSCLSPTRCWATGRWLLSCPNHWGRLQHRVWASLRSYNSLSSPWLYFFCHLLQSSPLLCLSPRTWFTGSRGHVLHQRLQHFVGRLFGGSQSISLMDVSHTPLFFLFSGQK